ncbi:MAG: O-antigen ligase family protein [Thermoanaerobaculia bacterium]
MTGSAVAPLKGWARAGWLAAATGAGLTVGLLATRIATPKLALVAVIGLLGAAAIAAIPELGLLALAFAAYLNLSGVLADRLPGPSLMDLLIPFLALVVLARWFVWRERPTGWLQPALLLTAYGVAGALSLLAAEYPSITLASLASLAKDGIIAVLVGILLRRGVTLRRVLWALLAAGLIMGTISVHQHLTGNFGSDYWGFANAPIPYSAPAQTVYRVAGPVGNPNYYGLILVALVPIAFDRLAAKRSLASRTLALWVLVACSLSIVFTYSRGAFLALLAVLVLLWFFRRPRPRHLLAAVVLAALLLPFVPSSYVVRMQTLIGALGGTGSHVGLSDSSLRGRLSENLAAVRMFLEHPWIGIGLGNYPTRYQDYSQQLLLDPRPENRSPHSLYLEIAAETGVIGLLAFGGVLWAVLSSILRASRSARIPQLTELRGMVVAVALALVGFLAGSLFLHASNARYLWLLVGVALALPRVAANEREALGAAAGDVGLLPRNS